MFNVGQQLSPLWQQLETLNQNLGSLISKSNANSWWSHKLCYLTFGSENGIPHGHTETAVAQIFCLDKLGVTFKVLNPLATDLEVDQIVFVSNNGNIFCFKTLNKEDYAKYTEEKDEISSKSDS